MEGPPHVVIGHEREKNILHCLRHFFLRILFLCIRCHVYNRTMLSPVEGAHVQAGRMDAVKCTYGDNRVNNGTNKRPLTQP